MINFISNIFHDLIDIFMNMSNELRAVFLVIGLLLFAYIIDKIIGRFHSPYSNEAKKSDKWNERYNTFVPRSSASPPLRGWNKNFDDTQARLYQNYLEKHKLDNKSVLAQAYLDEHKDDIE